MAFFTGKSVVIALIRKKSFAVCHTNIMLLCSKTKISDASV